MAAANIAPTPANPASEPTLPAPAAQTGRFFSTEHATMNVPTS